MGIEVSYRYEILNRLENDDRKRVQSKRDKKRK